jgi:predicted permease
LTAILTIALGIGGNAAIFGITDRVLLRPLPYHEPDRLVWIASIHSARGQYSKSSGWDFNSWKEQTAIFESVDAYWDRGYTITGAAYPEALVGWQFTPTLFATLGAQPALGRTFTSEDGLPGHDNVVVLSDALWRRRFDGASDAIGRTLQLDGRDYTIVGVMPPGFAHPYSIAQLWTPLTDMPALAADRKQRPLRVVARLRDGVTRRDAEAALASIAERMAREFPDTHAGWSASVRPLRDFYTGDIGQLLWVIQGSALILLLIAASNVASLVLVRASGRQRETAIRLALGAGKMTLLRMHLAEGLALATVAGALGLLLASWGERLLPRLIGERLRPLAIEVGPGLIDGRVILAAAAAAVTIGLLFGAAPLIHSRGRRQALAGTLMAGGRGSAGDRRTRLVRNGTVTFQVALSVALLIGAALLVRSFASLQTRTFGFRTAGVITAQLQLPGDRFGGERSAAFLERVVAGLEALPGVESAAAINTVPLTGFNALRPYQLPGRSPEDRFAEFRLVTPNYFRTMAIPLLRGRAFDDRDRSGTQPVVIVNETVARRLWPGMDPIGQTLIVPDMMTPEPRVVVGVAGDTRHHDLAKDPEPEIYRPAYQMAWPFFGLVVRTPLAAEQIERSLRQVAAGVDSSVPVSAVRAFDELADATWAWRRSSMAILSAFGGIAWLLALVGIYGVIAYSVTQRSREIGVRMALGARPADIARTILMQGTFMTGLGIGIGVVLSAALARALGTLLFGVAPIDPLTFLLVSIVTFVSSLAASAAPALLASRLDPNLVLRAE